MLWDRLRRMTRAELRWRVSTLIRARARQATAQVRVPQWRRQDILRVVNPAVREHIRRAVASERWSDVHTLIADRLRSRPARFVLDPSTRPRVRQAILVRDPAAAERARERAERVVGGAYDVLGYRGVRFTHDGRRVDWHFDPIHGRRAPRVFYTRVPYLDPAIGDHKIIWEINRHQHWLALGRAAWLTGDCSYRDAIVGELHGWLEANPPLIGINWASMLEIGFRAISWTWALHCLLSLEAPASTVPDPGLDTRQRGPGVLEPTPGTRIAAAGRIPGPDSRGPDPWLVDMLVALARQLTHIEQNLSYYFSPNTHLTGEALALYVVGAALPELAGADRWMATGRRILLEEIDRQILPDGGHAERSTHYQRYTLDFYLLALLTSRLTGDEGAARQFAGAAARLAEYTRVIAGDDGRLPLIGDDDGGMLWPIAGRACSDVRDSLAIAAVALNRPALTSWGATEETVWVAGPEAIDHVLQAPPDRDISIPSRAFTDTGYVVLRDGDGDHAVFDTGAHGFQNAGHAHADALAVTLTLARRPLLIDPGTATYTMDPALRDRLRSSACHNTITVDGQSQSVPAGPFHWRTRVDGRLEGWRHNDRFDFAQGAHDGYAPLEHRRVLVRIGSGSWFIADEVLGVGRHTAAAHWHFDPAWTLLEEPGRIRAVHASGDVAWLLHDGQDAERAVGDGDDASDWYAPVYGALVRAPAASVAVEGDAPLRMVTWVGRDDDWHSPRLTRIPVEGADEGSPLAAEIADGRRRALFVLRTGGAASAPTHGWRVAGQETDGRLLHCLADGDRLIRLDLVDVTRVATTRHGWLSFEAERPFGDLHIGVDRGFIDLRASIPAASLRLHGVPPTHRVRLNGREFLPSPTPPPSASLLIHPVDWHAPAATPTLLWSDPGAAFARP